jgi:N6-L-threonylcarbamoyladenine synthase
MKILAIDTATDETSAAVAQGTKVLSSVIWSQASLHAKWGGVVPSLAQREHEKRIDWVVEKAIQKSKIKAQNLDAIAVTAGPGLAIALGVGVEKAKRLAKQYNKPLIAVNHIEGHILSSLAGPKTPKLSFPAIALTVSGGNTTLTYVENIGKYKILAQTRDDALGEALDKAARMLGLGYPGGPILEKLARNGKPEAFPLPLPMAGQENEGAFSYSGLKTAMWRLVEQTKRERGGNLTKKDIENLAASFQSMAFKHLVRVSSSTIRNLGIVVQDLLVGGGVSANVELRRLLRKMGKGLGLTVGFPYSQKLMTDNAAMIGVVAGFKAKRGEYANPYKIDREASVKIGEKFSFEK